MGVLREGGLHPGGGEAAEGDLQLGAERRASDAHVQRAHHEGEALLPPAPFWPGVPRTWRSKALCPLSFPCPLDVLYRIYRVRKPARLEDPTRHFRRLCQGMKWEGLPLCCLLFNLQSLKHLLHGFLQKRSLLTSALDYVV